MLDMDFSNSKSGTTNTKIKINVQSGVIILDIASAFIPGLWVDMTTIKYIEISL